MIRETARIFWMMALLIAGGASMGLVSDWFGESLVWGMIGGYLSSALVVPLLWRRRLAISYPLVIGVGLLVTAATTFLPYGNAVFAGLLSSCAAAIVLYLRLPIVFPSRLPGLCPSCGYNLHRLRSPRCPECGRYLLPSRVTPAA